MNKKLLIGTVLFLTAAAVWAGPQLPPRLWDPSRDDRYFLEISPLRDELKGDLDGKLVLGTTNKAFFIPKLDPLWGLAISGGRMRKNGLWAVSYSQTRSQATFQSTSSRAVSHTLGMIGKGYLRTRGAVKPYIRFGFDIVWLHVSKGAERGSVLYGANYLGLGVGAGLGLLIQINPSLFMTAGGTYRFSAFMYAKGPGRGRDVTNLYIDRTGPRRDIFLKAPGPRIEIGLGYVFGKKKVRDSIGRR
jgi:hypothetical protein